MGKNLIKFSHWALLLSGMWIGTTLGGKLSEKIEKL